MANEFNQTNKQPMQQKTEKPVPSQGAANSQPRNRSSEVSSNSRQNENR